MDDTSDNEFHDAEDAANHVLEEKFSDALDLNESAEPESEPEPELTEEEKQANKEKAEQLKQDGNVCFKDADYEKSIEMYTEAIAICPKDFTVERSILFSNRAAAHKHLGAPDVAIEDCTKSIELNPSYIKAYARWVIWIIAIEINEFSQNVILFSLYVWTDEQHFMKKPTNSMNAWPIIPKWSNSIQAV